MMMRRTTKYKTTKTTKTTTSTRLPRGPPKESITYVQHVAHTTTTVNNLGQTRTVTEHHSSIQGPEQAGVRANADPKELSVALNAYFMKACTRPELPKKQLAIDTMMDILGREIAKQDSMFLARMETGKSQFDFDYFIILNMKVRCPALSPPHPARLLKDKSNEELDGKKIRYRLFNLLVEAIYKWRKLRSRGDAEPQIKITNEMEIYIVLTASDGSWSESVQITPIIPLSKVSGEGVKTFGVGGLGVDGKTRKWVTRPQMEDLKKTAVLIPVGQHWRLSFHIGVASLVDNLDRRRSCRKQLCQILRSLNSSEWKVGPFRLPTFVFPMLIVKEMGETAGDEAWDESKLGERFLSVLRFLTLSLNGGTLNNCFVDGENLFQGYFSAHSLPDIFNYLSRVEEMRRNPIFALQ